MSLANYLKKVVEGQHLSEEEAAEVATKIIKGEAPESLTAGILVALRMKGETPDEIVGFAKAMRRSALKINSAANVLDTAGTGGDGLGTLNVSTVVAILLSSLYPVAKHGNRAVSGKSGSADFLEALGYNIIVPPENAPRLLANTNFVFLFAQLYHPSMKNVAPIRKTLGVRTIFNILGPLTNPAGARYQLLGVFSKDYVSKLAEAVKRLDYDRVIIFHGEPGIDEVSPEGKTFVHEINGSKEEEYVITPSDFKAPSVPITKLLVKDPEESAFRALRASYGLDKDAEIFIRLNTALGLYLINKVKSLDDGYELAGHLLQGLPERLKEIIASNGDINRLNSLLVKVRGY
ncbi:MAG: anthranilate phosphoribosyltransferase [Sulfolobaceae archaeon]|nr:anthranilate phosphoribosyltransferase [Sulfolobaceae archaeon]